MQFYIIEQESRRRYSPAHLTLRAKLFRPQSGDWQHEANEYFD